MMKKISALILLAVFSWPVFAEKTVSDDAAANDTVERISLFLSEIGSLDGDFRQEVFDNRGDLVQQSSGRLKLLRPGRFKWEYILPYEQLIVADGQFLWIFDPELDQATVKPIGDALGSTPIMLLSQPRSVKDDFFVFDNGQDGELDWVELHPKVTDTDFKSVRFYLNDVGVQRMLLVDQFDQQTYVHLENVKVNVNIPASAFRFNAPPGVDVIGADEMF